MIQGSNVELLLVEDNPNDVFLLRKAFEKSGVNFYFNIATDGKEALDYLNKKEKYEQAKTPGIIILDLNLPKKNGFEVLKEIKNDKQLKKIPVIIFTTSASEEDIARSYELSANCYIVKPSSYKELLKVVELIKSFWLNFVRLPEVS